MWRCVSSAAGHAWLCRATPCGSIQSLPYGFATLTLWSSSCASAGGDSSHSLILSLSLPSTAKEAGSVLNQASTELESYRGPQLSLLRTFYLTIQVTHLLMAGQVSPPGVESQCLTVVLWCVCR